jgi:hypothetical protein
MTDTIEKITLDMLTPESVSVKRQQYVDVNGIEHPIGEPWRRAYVNNTTGRAAVEADLPEAYKSAVFAVWGNEPTITESTE